MPRKKKEELQVGDLVEVVAYDHTSDDTKEGWRTAEESKEVTPWTLKVVGYLTAADQNTITLAMAHCGGKFTTFWVVPRGSIIEMLVKRDDAPKKRN